MDETSRQATDQVVLPPIVQIARPSVADQVFEALQRRILRLELAPGSKMSEVEVATQMGVSRQPVREAFQRLAKQEFLLIRPQRSTTVSLISEAAVLRARFIRTALETHTCRAACERLTAEDFAAIDKLIEGQQAAHQAGDRERFHALDDEFHRQICERSGVGYVWDMIHDSKAHMDRIRMLSLDSDSQSHALVEHHAILTALRARDQDAAAGAMSQHLSRILVLIEQIKRQNHQWFTDAEH